MPADVDVMWTGPTVCSPELRPEDANGWTQALGDRRVIVWDNYPVNDALMTARCISARIRAAPPGSPMWSAGVLCNPMTQALASQVALATAMDFLGDPDHYDPADSWARAIDAVGGDRSEPLRVLARACADSPIAGTAALDLGPRVAALEDGLDGPDGGHWIAAVAGLRVELRAARDLVAAFPEPAAEGLSGLPPPRTPSARSWRPGRPRPTGRPMRGWPRCD